jgi:glucose/arabinose dehydrogenase
LKNQENEMNRMTRTPALILASLIFMAFPALAIDMPGETFNISPKNLPKPHATPAVDGTSQKIPRPANAWPLVPKGFAVSVFASGLGYARWMAVAPNGDVFLAQSATARFSC